MRENHTHCVQVSSTKNKSYTFGKHNWEESLGCVKGYFMRSPGHGYNVWLNTERYH